MLVYVNDLQPLVMGQGVQDVVPREASGMVPCGVHSLQVLDDCVLIHLLHVSLTHQVADVVDDIGELRVAISPILLLLFYLKRLL